MPKKQLVFMQQGFYNVGVVLTIYESDNSCILIETDH